MNDSVLSWSKRALISHSKMAPRAQMKPIVNFSRSQSKPSSRLPAKKPLIRQRSSFLLKVGKFRRKSRVSQAAQKRWKKSKHQNCSQRERFAHFNTLITLWWRSSRLKTRKSLSSSVWSRRVRNGPQWRVSKSFLSTNSTSKTSYASRNKSKIWKVKAISCLRMARSRLIPQMPWTRRKR